jgi:hypothetical protein
MGSWVHGFNGKRSEGGLALWSPGGSPGDLGERHTAPEKLQLPDRATTTLVSVSHSRGEIECCSPAGVDTAGTPERRFAWQSMQVEPRRPRRPKP